MYTVKNVKSFTGREGLGYECSLYKNGKKIGKVLDTANGGEVDFYLNDGEKKLLDAHCAALPNEPLDESYLTDPRLKAFAEENYPDGRPVECDSFVTLLVEKFENDTRMKRSCKKNTVVKVTVEGKEVFYTYKTVFTPQIKKAIKDRDYPTQEVTFMNELYS